jgi:hypothetical protein
MTDIKFRRVNGILLFQKRSKSVSSASQKTMATQIFREAEPGGFGGLPPRKQPFSNIKAI